MHKLNKTNIMKNINTLTLITITALLCSGSVFGQKLIDQEKALGLQLIKKLNTPTKIWTNGHWEIQPDGSKIWIKGHWRFEQKSFEQKSQIYREKIQPKPKA